MADAKAAQSGDVVVDSGKGGISDFWKKEDYWAIWIGFAILIVGMLIYFNSAPKDMDQKIAKANKIMTAEEAKAPFKTIAWFKAADSKKKLKANSSPIGKTLKSFMSKPGKWSGNPLDSFFMSSEAAKAKAAKAKPKYDKALAAEKVALAKAQTAEEAAAKAQFKDEKLNAAAQAEIYKWRDAHFKTGKAKKKTKVHGYNRIPTLIGLFVVFGVIFGIGWAVMGKSFGKFFLGFIFVFIMANVAYFASANAMMKQYGIGYAAWAIFVGMLIANTVGTPKWALEACQTEYYIKTGLVLLGAEILFGKILSIGIPGIFVAWVVTPIVLISTYLFGQKILKIGSKTLNITISADMSVCGVSAAIATAAACRAKKEELTLAVGLSLVFTSIMMIVMPAIIKGVGMPEVLGGAWMGGTIDATGAVAAAGAFLGEKALYTAATIKMIQNVLDRRDRLLRGRLLVRQGRLRARSDGRLDGDLVPLPPNSCWASSPPPSSSPPCTPPWARTRDTP